MGYGPLTMDFPLSYNYKQENMSERKQQNVDSTLFTKENYTWMLIGGVVIALAMLLMSGGRSTDPKVFDTKEVYSTTRITIAPMLIIAGFIIEIFAIMKKSKSN